MKNIPLTELTVSSRNVRKTNQDRNIDQLVASIRTHGLLENLIVIETDDGYEIIGGGRRLRALQQLQQQGQLAADYAAPCHIVATNDAAEISLIENTVREAMHPADQFEAWAYLADNGMPIADIAARFGVSDNVVRQRLKLGRLSPKLMQAYRDEEISLEALMACTLSDDHDRQEAVFESLRGSWSADSAHSIRHMLTEHSVSETDLRARFVGVDEYAQAGGNVRRDLFEDECYFDDIELLNRLAEEKLEEQAVLLRAKWAWVETRLTFAYDERIRFHRIHPHALGEVPAELNDQHNALVEQIESMNLSDEADAADVAELEEALSKVEAQIDAYHGFTDEERRRSGCVVTLDYQGLSIHEGLVRPEDIIDDARDSETSSVDDSQAAAYCKPLLDRLERYRLHALRMELTSDFQAAFDSLTYAMCLSSFGQSPSHWLAATFEPQTMPRSMQHETAIQAMIDAESAADENLPMAWLNEAEESQRFASFCSLPQADKQELFAACVARLMRPQLSTSSHASVIWEQLATRLDLDIASYWRPSGENFFSRLKKSQLLELAGNVISDEWAANYRKSSKSELVAALDRAFSLWSDWRFSDEQIDRLVNWLPPELELKESSYS